MENPTIRGNQNQQEQEIWHRYAWENYVYRKTTPNLSTLPKSQKQKHVARIEYNPRTQRIVQN